MAAPATRPCFCEQYAFKGDCVCASLEAAGTTSVAARAAARELPRCAVDAASTKVAAAAGAAAASATGSSGSGAGASPSVLLLEHVRHLATMDDEGTEIKDAYLLIVDGVIQAVGPMSGAASMEREFATALSVHGLQRLDCRNHVVLPGLVNTHHHMFQTLTRCVAQDASLFVWLQHLYEPWCRLTGDDLFTATQTAMAEMLLSGCTCASDHHYVFPNDVTLDHQIRAAREVGMRFTATRGAMSLGKSKGGLPPDRLVEEEPAILADMERLVRAYHDPARYSMLRIALAPCSPFSVTEVLMRDAAVLARAYPGVRLHTHREYPEVCMRPTCVASSRIASRLAAASDIDHK